MNSLLLTFLLSISLDRKSMQLVKDARFAGDVLRLTGPQKYKTGAAWAKEAQPLSNGFETTFRFQLTEPADNIYGSADGFAFVLQTEGPNAIAGRGSAGGFSLGRGPNNPQKKAIPRSLAIFFDTFKNDEEEDLSGNSIGLFTNGDGFWLPRRLAINSNPQVNVKDQRVHQAKIVYSQPKLTVFVDEELVLEATVDLESIVGKEGKGFVGFTAATGEGYQNHDILSWTFNSEAARISSSIQYSDHDCLPNRTLCTPERGTVEALGQGRFKLRVPAHLQWGVSIDSVSDLKITNLRGTVCWNAQAKAAHSCNGPEGDRSQQTSQLLEPKAAAGSLIQRRLEGKIYFSVNGTKSGFEYNEGYFEFEVETSSRR
jgi:hypothetical protein